MKVFDVAFENDLVFGNGDFKIIESTAQHIGFLLISEQGEWKYAPRVGAGIRQALNEDGDLLVMQGIIQGQLEADSMSVKELRLDDTIYVDAEYKQSNF